MGHYNLYESLGLSRQDSSEELGAQISARLSALRQQGMTDDSPEVDEATTALQILGNPELRRMHDTRLDDPHAPAIDVPALHELAAAAPQPQLFAGVEQHDQTSAPAPESAAESLTGSGARHRVAEHEEPGTPGPADGQRPQAEQQDPMPAEAHDPRQSSDLTGVSPASPLLRPEAGQQQGSWQPAQNQAVPNQAAQNQAAQNWQNAPGSYYPAQNGVMPLKSRPLLVDAPERDFSLAGGLRQLPGPLKGAAYTALGMSAIFLLAILVLPFLGGRIIGAGVQGLVSQSGLGIFGSAVGLGSAVAASVALVMVPVVFVFCALLLFQALAAVAAVVSRAGELMQALVLVSFLGVALGALAVFFVMPFGVSWTALVMFIYSVAMIVLLALPQSRAWFNGKVVAPQQPQQYSQPQQPQQR